LDYILNTALGVQSDKAKPAAAEAVFKKYRDAVQAISRKLGGLRALEILADLQLAEERYFKDHQLELNKVWIAKLLQYYYDPLYAGSLERRQVKVIFQGRSADILDKLKDFRAGC
jgi:tRNA 2-selenouridine synthase